MKKYNKHFEEIINHNYYCEYRYCRSRDTKLVPFRTKQDWGLRMLHKCCYKEIKQNLTCYECEDNYIQENPLNPKFTICKCYTNAGNPCKMDNTTDDFNNKFGYCRYHNFKKFHDIYN